jgi:hypothetical protein
MKKQKCDICQEECDGTLHMIDPQITEDVICCKICFNLWANQDYDELTKRVKK